MISAGWNSAAISFVCVVISTPIVMAVCRRWNLYDSAGSLKIHNRLTSRLGGVGIAVGLAIAVVFEGRATTQELVVWLAAFGVISLTGFMDDVRGASLQFRLAAQILSGVLLWRGGWRLAFGGPVIVSAIAVCAIVILFVNAFNFLDGSDGLAAGVTAVIAIAYILACGTNAPTIGFAVAWGLSGACVGFLIFNYPPAKIFMGDSGSTALGFCTAFLSIDFILHSSAQPTRLRWLFPVVIAGVPVVDAIVVVSRRVLGRNSPFLGNRSHYYDLLMAKGWSARKVALTSYAITGMLVAVGLSMTKVPATAISLILTAIAAGIFLAALVRRGSSNTSHRKRNAAPANSYDALHD